MSGFAGATYSEPRCSVYSVTHIFHQAGPTDYRQWQRDKKKIKIKNPPFYHLNHHLVDVSFANEYDLFANGLQDCCNSSTEASSVTARLMVKRHKFIFSYN